MTASAAIEPRSPVPAPGTARVDPMGRSPRERRGPRDGRRAPARPVRPPTEDDDLDAPPPPRGRLDILA